MKRQAQNPFLHAGAGILPDDMGRRRFQSQRVQKRKGKRESWCIRYRTYPPEGPPVYKREFLGYCPTTADPDKRRERGEITLREAERKAEAILARINVHAGSVGATDITLREFVELHWTPRHCSTLGAGTARKYASHLRNHVVPALGDRLLSKVGAARVQDLINGLTASWHTKQDVRMVVSSIFTKAAQWGFYEGKNPAEDVYCGRKKLARARVILSPKQVEALVAVLPEPSRTLVLLLDATGMRVSEALGLQERHIDYPAKGFATISQRWSRGDLDEPKTATSARVVSLAGWEPHGLLGRPGRFIFDRGDGLPHDDRELAKDQLRPTLKSLGFWVAGLGWHSFRRKAATELQRAGASSIETARVLGQAKVDVTAEYTVLGAERMEEIAKRRKETVQ